jgi:hypothetical protein
LRALAVAFCAEVFHCLVNRLLELVRRDIGESLAGFADGLMKGAPADGFLDELRQIAFFRALSAQKGTQGTIGVFGPGNGQTGGFRLRPGALNHTSIYPLIGIGSYGTGCQTGR